jgi:hypothetical protein
LTWEDATCLTATLRLRSGRFVAQLIRPESVSGASVELGVLLRRLGRAGEAEGYLQGRSGSGNREGPGKPNTRLRA